jgi:prepilin-type processing-associated H-X9-DG protein
MLTMLPGFQGPWAPNNTGTFLYTDRLHGNSRYVKSLTDNAAGREAIGSLANPAGGHSYEVSGFFAGQNGSTVDATQNIRKTERTSLSHQYINGVQGGGRYNFSGMRASPSDTWVMYDADDAGGGDRPNGDFPDRGDNHGADGANVVFGDGHAEWVTSKKYVGSFIRGTDENHLLSLLRNSFPERLFNLKTVPQDLARLYAM